MGCGEILICMSPGLLSKLCMSQDFPNSWAAILGAVCNPLFSSPHPYGSLLRGVFCTTDFYVLHQVTIQSNSNTQRKTPHTCIGLASSQAFIAPPSFCAFIALILFCVVSLHQLYDLTCRGYYVVAHHLLFECALQGETNVCESSLRFSERTFIRMMTGIHANCICKRPAKKRKEPLFAIIL